MLEDHLDVFLFPVLGVGVEARRGSDDANGAALAIEHGETAAPTGKVGCDIHAGCALPVVRPKPVARDYAGREEVVGVARRADETNRRSNGGIHAETRNR